MVLAFFFWYAIFPLILYFIFAAIVLYVMRKEKRDAEFAKKMDRFRDYVERKTPPKGVRIIISNLIVWALLLYLIWNYGPIY